MPLWSPSGRFLPVTGWLWFPSTRGAQSHSGGTTERTWLYRLHTLATHATAPYFSFLPLTFRPSAPTFDPSVAACCVIRYPDPSCPQATSCIIRSRLSIYRIPTLSVVSSEPRSLIDAAHQPVAHVVARPHDALRPRDACGKLLSSRLRRERMR